MRASPRVLLVGAGAVGQVFAKYLQAAGCEVSFLVKPAHAAEARGGFTLHAFRGLSRTPRPLSLSGVEVLVSLEEVAARRWEQVWLCVSSSALRAGTWVAELARATGGATWVTLQPALEDRDWLLQRVPAERLVCGNIPFLSFAAPLAPGGTPASGTVFWLPPLAQGLFSGPEHKKDRGAVWGGVLPMDSSPVEVGHALEVTLAPTRASLGECPRRGGAPSSRGGEGGPWRGVHLAWRTHLSPARASVRLALESVHPSAVRQSHSVACGGPWAGARGGGNSGS
jgi:Ketopantoate reductase PanE/ApbA